MGQAEIETATQGGDRGSAVTAIEIPGSLSNHRHFSLGWTEAPMFHAILHSMRWQNNFSKRAKRTFQVSGGRIQLPDPLHRRPRNTVWSSRLERHLQRRRQANWSPSAMAYGRAVASLAIQHHRTGLNNRKIRKTLRSRSPVQKRCSPSATVRFRPKRASAPTSSASSLCKARSS
jgi:hypothetical protein